MANAGRDRRVQARPPLPHDISAFAAVGRTVFAAADDTSPAAERLGGDSLTVDLLDLEPEGRIPNRRGRVHVAPPLETCFSFALARPRAVGFGPSLRLFRNDPLPFADWLGRCGAR